MLKKRLYCEALEGRDLLSTVAITGLHHEQIYLKSPGNGTTIDLSGGTFLALEDTHFPIGEPLPASWPARGSHPEYKSASSELYPITIKGTSANLVVNGGTIKGLMDERAPWGTWKDYSDGDGLRVEGSVAYEIKNTFISNTFDGIGPRGSVGATFNIHDVFLDRIKDDMVENDDFHSGTIANSYMRGFVFLSAVGGSMVADPNSVVKVQNTIVELLPEVYRDKLGTGAMFKWDYAGTAKVDVRDSVFFVPSKSSIGTKIMQFAPGTYSNVTVVWQGTGAYPWPAPKGVTITRDRTVYDNAVKAFFAAHPQFAPDGIGMAQPVEPSSRAQAEGSLLVERQSIPMESGPLASTSYDIAFALAVEQLSDDADGDPDGDRPQSLAMGARRR